MSGPAWIMHEGDCRAVLPTLAARSVHCIVTSPPYYGLRDYGVDGQIGLEATPEAYVGRLVEVFREARRVLRDDGTLWLNLGDSYSGSGPSGASYQSETTKRRAAGNGTDGNFRVSKRLSERGLTYAEKKPIPAPGLKPKDLIGIPWRVAFALQADGWYLRSDIIWAKPNPMPESVTDRPTRSHEYLFLLAKGPRYYYDADAVREDCRTERDRGRPNGRPTYEHFGVNSSCGTPSSGRNRRSVWTIPTKPYKGAHFATFPRDLVEPCILAGTSERGCCPACGAPWERVVERTPYVPPIVPPGVRNVDPSRGDKVRKLSGADYNAQARSTTLGWSPTCTCDGTFVEEDAPADWASREGGKPRKVRRFVPGPEGVREPLPCVVLDPFAGSGTTGAVAVDKGRSFVGVELNPAYWTLGTGQITAEAERYPLFPLDRY